MIIFEALLWIIVPAINFIFWYQIGFQQETLQEILLCPELINNNNNNNNENELRLNPQSHGHVLVKDSDISFTSIPSSMFQQHREERIVKLNYPHHTTLLNYYPSTSCDTIANSLVSEDTSSCFGIVLENSSQKDNSDLLLRYEREGKDPPLHFSGFFSKPGNLKGRKRFSDKLQPLLASLEEVEKEMDELLLERNIQRGDDIVVMVVNEGEMDLFMNFVCSCQYHNLSLNQILVFSASGEIIPLITATGALGYYHSEFATASKEHSVAYLDGVFVDMMWYKAFSVWLLLHLERNVLFQDIDIIWLKNPFPYFHNALAALKSSTSSPSPPLPDAFLSDDGQRASPRFSPFYANSGFYYFISNSKTIHVSWLIMLTFDVMQSGGSHQNVFTQRLLEVFDQYGLITQSLSLRDFTNGAIYHHTPSFITKMQHKTVIPYMFHMCWTANKSQKLLFFNLTHMWYLKEGLGYHDFKAESSFNQYALHQSQRGEGKERERGEEGEGNIWKQIWKKLEKQICSSMPNSP